jgi:hypothetical protein
MGMPHSTPERLMEKSRAPDSTHPATSLRRLAGATKVLPSASMASRLAWYLLRAKK